ncbi:hypothetical protein I308_101588 [Cryptococcus tetragattii IND107]|uniref:CENP-V/GFA domain-containing protein n=1 Tax=Cryptococcus tetragattii IND107 TaxID=1296105 RepID=A0ABR3C0Q8_9TREE
MPVTLTGGCSCTALTYRVSLDSLDDARVTLCHCSSCKKAFGGDFGLTAKIPVSSFRYTQGQATEHKTKNGVKREFCSICGSYILEYGEAAANDFRYIVVGSLDEPAVLPPKGEFFCRNRLDWMPQIPNTFQKQEIKQ